MLLLNPDGTVANTRYSIAKLKRDHPNTSFPAEIPAALLAEYNVFEAVPTAEPAHTDSEIAEQTGNAVKVGDEWQWEWVVRPKTSEEQAQELHNRRQNVRAQVRSRILALAPEWKQRNYLARSLELLRKGEANLTVEEAAQVTAMSNLWVEIRRLRARSDTLEANPPEDPTLDEHWV